MFFFDCNVSSKNLFSLFLQKSDGLYFLPAGSLLLIVTDR